MATNRQAFIRNKNCCGPVIELGLFQAGSTQVIKQGEILELTAGGSTKWVPLDSDYAMASDVSVANEEIFSTDLAGYYEIIVPQIGDVFSFELATAAAPAFGAALYYNTSQKVTTTAGTNVIGRVADTNHYPQQGHAYVGEADQGSTILTISYVAMSFVPGVSFAALAEDPNT